MSVRVLWAMVLLAFGQAFGAGPAKILIAVNDLAAQGVDASTAAIISERLRVELTASQSFRVMERSQMDEVLKEQGFQQSGACSDDQCAVEIGKILGVHQMVIGTLGRVGTLHTISLKLVDVGSSEILATATEDCSCPIEEVVTKTIRTIAAALDAKVRRSLYGALKIVTDPKGAEVLLNGKSSGTADYANESLEPGTYRLRVQKPSYEPVEQDITIDKGKTLELSFKLAYTQAYRDSTKQAQAKKHTRGLIVRQIILGCLVVGCGAGGYYYNSKAEDAIKEYDDAYDAYASAPEGSDFGGLWARHESIGEEINDHILVRNLLYIGTGACALGFTISFFF